MAGLLQLLLLDMPVQMATFGDNNSNPTLFYPGSGEDFSPINCFLQNKNISTFVYCDYTLADIVDGTAESYKRIMRSNLPGCDNIAELNPKQFGAAATWADFWHDSIDSRKFAQADKSFGLSTVFTYHGAKKRFIFLKTEALGTYRMLWGRQCKSPAYVYLKDHGFGLNWTQFSGPNGLYREASKNPPKFICSAYHGDPEWPGYKEAEDLPCGKLYRHI